MRFIVKEFMNKHNEKRYAILDTWCLSKIDENHEDVISSSNKQHAEGLASLANNGA